MHEVLPARHWGHHVCIIENKAGERAEGLTLDMEIPSEMLAQIPNIYPDLGVLVQKEHGIELKDPYVYITKGAITRMIYIKDAVRNALAAQK